MMGEKLESVSITAYRGREVYGGYSKLTISTLSESNAWGKKSWKKRGGKKTEFEKLDSYWDTLNRVGRIYNVMHAWTLKKLVRRVKEFTGRQQWNSVTQIEASGVNVFKILTLGPIREQQNLTLANRLQ